MSSGMSTSGVEAFTLEVDAAAANPALRDMDPVEIFPLNLLSSWIVRNGYKRVSLQFPDRLLPLAIPTCRILENSTDAKYFILGDTTYCSCCVDEIAAEHASCDAVVHFGSSCLSPNTRLPVALVPEQQLNFNFDQCVAELRRVLEKHAKVVLLYDFDYLFVAGRLRGELQGNHSFSLLQVPDNQEVIANEESSSLLCSSVPDGHKVINRRCIPSSDLEDPSTAYVFIGDSGPCMVNLFLQLGSSTFYKFDPKTSKLELESAQVNKRIMRRNHFVEKAKAASIVGILVGTLGVQGYLSIIDRLKSVLRAAGKRYYTFAMGKPNPAKLANFLEIDIFIYVACPESYFDSKEFLRPVITPHEMEIACGVRSSSEGVVADFRELLNGGKHHVDLPAADQQKEVDDVVASDVSALVLRDQVLTLAETTTTAADFLKNRSWRGLEADYTKREPAVITEGRHGIAAGYDEEVCCKKELCCKEQSCT